MADADFSRVRAVFTDVDGTLTTGGKLRASTIAALERLQGSGLRVVLVTGRSSGWAECWARNLPVDGVIAENGGLYFAWRKRKLVKIYAQPAATLRRNRARLVREVNAALRKVRGARLSIDSLYTEVDIAIDYNEDARLGESGASALENFLRARGITAVRSNVHVNCWIGRFDKISMVRRYLKTEFRGEISEAECIYAGDSFNDAPMFGAFALSVGVGNVRDVLDRLDAPPKFITSAREGAGFEELAGALLRA